LASALTGTLWQAAFFEYMLDDRELLGKGETKFLEQVVDLFWQTIDPTTHANGGSLNADPKLRRSPQAAPKRPKPAKNL